VGSHTVQVSNSLTVAQHPPVKERSIFDRATSFLGGVASDVQDAYTGKMRDITIDNIYGELKNLPVRDIQFKRGDHKDALSLTHCDNPTAPQKDRTYWIEIDANNPRDIGRVGDKEEEITTVHEKTHVAADRAYLANKPKYRMQITHAVPGDKAEDAVFESTNQAIDNRLQKLESIVANDPMLSDDEREAISTRVRYAGQPIEYDSVVNELTVHTKLYGISSSSDTSKALVTLADENMKRRNDPGEKFNIKSPI
jgi:hypothetical protein